MKIENLQAKVRAKMERLDEIDNLEYADMTNEISAEADQLVADVQKLRKEIDNLAKRQALRDDLANDVEDPIIGTKVHEEPKNKAEEPKNVTVPKQNIEVKPHEYKDFGEQLMDVYTVANVNAMSEDRQKAVKRLEEIRNAATGLGESVPSDGGFLVQTDFVSTLLARAYDTGVLVGGCTRMPISARANSTKIPGVDETSRADGSRWGGIQAYWEGEGAELTGTKPKFREIKLELSKLTGLCYATDEMLEDTQLLSSFIVQGFSEEFGFKFDDAIFRGTGAGQPLGLLNANCLVSQAKETGQAADTIVAENIEKMFSRMDPRSLARAKWYINQECWPQIFQLHHVVGTGGVPMYMEPGKLPDTPNGSLLGKPIEVLEQCSALGDKGDIMFADLSRYIWADKGGMKAATSMHVRFVYDETAFRFIVRVDGQPMFDSPLTPYKGTATTSPFVTLNARA